MATTTNYSWTTPDDTALVKDGAAAIRSLGTAIDTTVFTNAGAAVAKATVDAKGDLIAGTADNTVARLAVGANDTILVADSSTATGLKWAAPAGGGGMTSLASGSLAAAAVGFDLTNINQTYNSLILYVSALSANATGLGYNNTITLNNDTGNNYSFTGTRDGSVVNVNSGAGIDVMSNEQATGTFSIFAQFYNYADTTSKKLYTTLGNSHATVIPKSISGMWADNSAINRITLTLGAGAYDAGTYVLYGVK